MTHLFAVPVQRLDRAFSPFERARLYLGWLLWEWHKRSMEFACACASLINAHSTLVQTPQGKPLAPFLSSALDFLSSDPIKWALALAVVGFLHLTVVLFSLFSGKDWYGLRAVATGIQALTYVAISTAVITGPPPPEAAARYVLTAWMMFWVSVALGSRALPRSKGGACG